MAGPVEAELEPGPRSPIQIHIESPGCTRPRVPSYNRCSRSLRACRCCCAGWRADWLAHGAHHTRQGHNPICLVVMGGRLRLTSLPILRYARAPNLRLPIPGTRVYGGSKTKPLLQGRFARIRNRHWKFWTTHCGRASSIALKRSGPIRVPSFETGCPKGKHPPERTHGR